MVLFHGKHDDKKNIMTNRQKNHDVVDAVGLSGLLRILFMKIQLLVSNSTIFQQYHFYNSAGGCDISTSATDNPCEIYGKLDMVG